MTEADWNSCTDPQALLDFLHDSGKLSDRKARLFAVACCRRIWHLLTDARSRTAVAVAERYADGQVTVHQLAVAHVRAWDPAFANPAQAAVLAAAGIPLGRAFAKPALQQAQAVATDTAWAAAKEAWDAVLYASTPTSRAAAWAAAKDSALATQVTLLLCIVGNPFYPVSLDPTWLVWHDGLIRQLAQAAYQERQLPSGLLDLDRLAVLADGLEESGCTDPEMLAHLRGPGPHTRGCWAVDTILAKE
jgi:hypothetical protein